MQYREIVMMNKLYFGDDLTNRGNKDWVFSMQVCKSIFTSKSNDT
jgi:hypothetical protein